MKKLIALWLLCFVPGFATSQGVVSPTHLEALKKLSYLVGEYKGSGWISFGGDQKWTFTSEETIQSKLGGTVLLIEGLGKHKSADGTERIGHQALAVLSYDDKGKRYRLSWYRPDGTSGESEARLLDRGLEWSLPNPKGGTLRWTIKILEGGEWFEIGEFSKDGKDWTKFFEMTLQRVK